MALRLKAMLENKAKLATEIKRQADMLHVNGTTRDFTAEEKPQWDKLNADYDANDRAIAIEQRAAGVSGGFSPPPAHDIDRGRGAGGVSEADRTLAMAAWMGRSTPGFAITDDHTDAARRCGVNIHSNSLDVSLAPTAQYQSFQRKFRDTPLSERENLRIGATGTDMTVGTGSAGGSFVPPGELLNQLELNMLWFGPMRQVAETVRTSTGEALQWPTADDTGNVGEQLAEEGSISATVTSASPTVALTQYLAYKFSSKPTLVTAELLQDSMFNLPTLIGQMLGERLGRITNTKYTTGSGTSTPQGITIGAAAGQTSGSATAFTADDVISLYHSVDIAYRAGASFMMHDSVIAFMRKLKDGQGQYLWRSGLADGRPDQLLGCPVWANNDMNSTFTTGLKMALFGQLSKFKIRTVGQIRFIRLVELYRDLDRDGFIAFIREDGRLLNAGTNPVKYLKLM